MIWSAFLSNHPRSVTIVNLGAGLDTGFYRVDNGFIQWIDVDLPEVIELRKTVIPETDSSRRISGSPLDRHCV
jgi:O-methyltransferase involved in polyketide biosynthesis